jgi:hypothetical protein
VHKGTVSPVKICLKVVCFDRPGMGCVMLDFKIFKFLPEFFFGSFEVVKQPLQMLTVPIIFGGSKYCL